MKIEITPNPLKLGELPTFRMEIDGVCTPKWEDSFYDKLHQDLGKITLNYMLAITNGKEPEPLKVKSINKILKFWNNINWLLWGRQ